MIKFAAVLLGLMVVTLIGLWVYGTIYTARVQKSFPPIGEFVSVDGVRLHVKSTTTANASAHSDVVLIHGASANLREFESNLVPALQSMVDLISLDRPGHGYSDRTDNADELGEQARLLMSAIREKTDGPVVLVGHSFGGAVSLRLALDYPDNVKGLVLLAPATHGWDGDTTWYNRAVANPVFGTAFARVVSIIGPHMAERGIVGVFKPDPIPEGYANNLGLPLLFRPGNFRANGMDMSAANAEFRAQSKRYGELSLPVIVFSASKDHVLSPKIHAYALSKQAESVELRVLPEGGHMPHHTHTEDVKKAILSLAKSESGQ